MFWDKGPVGDGSSGIYNNQISEIHKQHLSAALKHPCPASGSGFVSLICWEASKSEEERWKAGLGRTARPILKPTWTTSLENAEKMSTWTHLGNISGKMRGKWWVVESNENTKIVTKSHFCCWPFPSRGAGSKNALVGRRWVLKPLFPNLWYSLGIFWGQMVRSDPSLIRVPVVSTLHVVMPWDPADKQGGFVQWWFEALHSSCPHWNVEAARRSLKGGRGIQCPELVSQPLGEK